MIVDIFVYVCQLLKMENYLNVNNASKLVRKICKEKLLSAIKEIFFGFKYSKPYLLSNKSIDNEMNWLLKHLFIFGLHKAISNIYFICIFYIKYQTSYRFNSPNFEPYCNSHSLNSIKIITNKIKS